MKIVSYNVNGIRAALRKDFVKWLQATQPNVVCLQETKATPEQIDTDVFENLGYNVSMHSAEKKGYSGVAILSKEKPIEVSEGLGHPGVDIEGRVLTAQFDKQTVVSAYFPSGASSPDRQDYKLRFLQHFDKFLKKFPEDRKPIICGDFNICHLDIDIHAPQRYRGMPGFSDSERTWVTKLLESGYIDAFRSVNPEPKQYSWWSYMGRSRERNVGWRIDYIMLPEEMEARLRSSMLLSKAYHSDHCPVLVELEH